ncbi:hypothetical protein LTR17_002976 [Elasticomyces elasticus]|nr:hypothetical protein LTR17_002976 [Elasticomyces elasticus]
MSASTAALGNTASLEVETSSLEQTTNHQLSPDHLMAQREASLAQREGQLRLDLHEVAERKAEQDKRQTEQDQREKSLRRSKDDVDFSYRTYQLRIQEKERKLLSRERVPNVAFKFVDMEGKRLKAKQKVFRAFEESEEAFREEYGTFDEEKNERKRRNFYHAFSKRTGLSVAEVEAMHKEGPLRMVVEHHLPAIQDGVSSGEADGESDALLSGDGGMC